jgi:hypothetical protein
MDILMKIKLSFFHQQKGYGTEITFYPDFAVYTSLSVGVVANLIIETKARKER